MAHMPHSVNIDLRHPYHSQLRRFIHFQKKKFPACLFCDPYGAQQKINIQLLSTVALVNFALHGTFLTLTMLPHNPILPPLCPPKKNP